MAYPHKPSLCERSNSGFALIIALALMAFILLLLGSLSILVRLETMAAVQAREMEAARHHAILGLQTALGELQMLAGPDQRITATAGIRGDAEPGAIHWTGVWQSRQEGGRADAFLNWLVSMPVGTASADRENLITSVPSINTGSPRWTSADDGWVILVGEGAVETSEGAAMAAKLPIPSASGDPSGHYAFWVGDEGVKARVNLAYDADADVLEQLLLTPPFAGYALLDRDMFENLPPDDSRVGRSNSLSDWAGMGLAGKDHFHDLSFHSRGVLADVREGGLKRDLTHLFEHDEAFAREFGGPGDTNFLLGANEAEWPASGGTTPFPHGGPNWGILRAFYHLHEATNGVDLTTMIAAVPESTNEPRNYHDSRERYQQNSPVHPLFGWFQMSLGLRYDVIQSDAENIYHPVIYIRPLVALYNPYDVRIPTRNYDINARFNPRMEIEVEGREPVVFHIHEVRSSRKSSGVGTYFSWRLHDVDLLPGEMRYYGLDGPYPLNPRNASGNPISRDSNLTADWEEDGIYFVAITEDDSIEQATAEGATTSHSGYPAEFGLTTAEIERLRVSVAKSATGEEMSPLPSVEIRVVYTAGSSRAFNLDASGVSTRLVDMDRSLGGSDSTPGPGNVTITFSSLSAAHPDIATLGFGLRATTMDMSPQRQFVDANLRAIRISRTNENADFTNAGPPLPPGWGGRGFGTDIFDQYQPEIIDFDRYSGSFGSTYLPGFNASERTTVLFHVPRTRPLSLGLLQHANVGKYSRDPTYIVGASYAPARIPLGQHSVAARYYYDWAYLVNRALWDSSYFSGIPQDMSDDLLNDYRNGRVLAPNPRLSFHEPKGMELNATVLTDASSAMTARTVAASLMVEGAFNINSTSIPAWKAFLASNAGLAIPRYNPDTGALVGTSRENQTFFFRTPVPYAAAFDSPDNNGSFWNTYRRLSDDELADLAGAMVDEVRARGPFSSLSDFVNRRLEGPDEQRRRGALQAALDTTVNRRLDTSLVGSPSGNELFLPGARFQSGNFNPEDRPGTGGTGWILQGDVLQSVGPLVAARSDTFRIRAYGDSINPLTGNVTARAWCEAIVQRLPDPVTTSSAFSTDELVYPPDQTGRRFVIVDFRWLDLEEI